MQGLAPSKTSWRQRVLDPVTLGTAALALVMVLVSAYLMQHYYAVYFPRTTFFDAPMCQISDYFSCDTAVFSPLSNILGVPIAAFGILLGCIFFCSELSSNPWVQRSNAFLAACNAAGCFALLLYSVLILGGLCPGCLLYYICSFLILALYYLRGALVLPIAGRVLAAYAVLGALGFGALYTLNADTSANDAHFSERLIKEVHASPDFEHLGIESGFMLNAGKGGIKGSKLRVSLISDFQCPVCAVFATQIMPQLIKRYGDDLSVQYFFYPLDPACHPRVTSLGHPLACEAAYLAYCAKDRFLTIHDEIFAQENKLSKEWLNETASKLGLSSCVSDPLTKVNIQAMIASADRFEISGTPTMIVNGKRLDGVLPVKYLFVLFDSFLHNQD